MVLVSIIGIAVIWGLAWWSGVAYMVNDSRVASAGVTMITCTYISATSVQQRQYAFEERAAETFGCPWMLRLTDSR